MGEVVSIFKNRDIPVDSDIDNRKLTPELIRHYKETIVLVSQYQDQLEKEDWVHAYGMILNFNHILMNHINSEEKE